MADEHNVPHQGIITEGTAVTDILVLWDVDGTLVDAAGVGREAMGRAFVRVFGKEPTSWPGMGGRTDRAILLDLLRMNGVAYQEDELEAYRAAAEEAFLELLDELAERGRALPGALEALTALRGRPVVQSLLTGNIRRIAEAKMHTFGLLEHLDLDIGAYGWSHPVRAYLVETARAAAAERHGRTYPGRSTVLVGDTPLDVEAALAAGASVVGVATGRFSADELVDAGAHVVLADLTSTDEVVNAISEVARSAEDGPHTGSTAQP
jgi:phosphoglycolate phosphatase-like HAD superfamily hydrolase